MVDYAAPMVDCTAPVMNSTTPVVNYRAPVMDYTAPGLGSAALENGPYIESYSPSGGLCSPYEYIVQPL